VTPDSVTEAVVPAPRWSAVPRWGVHPTVWLMASVHLSVDAYANAFAPLLPLLIPRLGLTLTAVGTLAMLFQFAGSMSQLAFGALADRWRPRVLLLGGPFVAVVGLSCIGLARTPVELALILMVGGLGTAAFHPPAAMLAHRLGGLRPGLSMSVYVSGGTLGFAFGPLIFAPFAERFGLSWTPLLALPGLALVAFFMRLVPPVERAPVTATRGWSALRPYARPLTLLYFIVVLRTLVSSAMATFVPVMLTRRGMSVSEAAAAIALYLMASGLGGFFGGTIADRIGPRRVIFWSQVLAVPFLATAPMLDGWPLAVVLALGGLVLQSTLPVNVMFGQSIAPVSAATVSSLMMGVAWGTGGAAVPLVGMTADRAGIGPTLVGIAFLPLVAALLASRLPRTHHEDRHPGQAVRPA
jgi:MFS transporter, FSR family, fosmidomycin resistance protein